MVEAVSTVYSVTSALARRRKKQMSVERTFGKDFIMTRGPATSVFEGGIYAKNP